MIARLRSALAGPHPLVLRVLMDMVILVTIISLGALVRSWATDATALVTTTDLNWNTILLAIISLLGTIFTGVMAVYMAKVNASTKKTEESTKKTEESTTAIHVAVNSERTAAVNTIKELRDEILRLSKSNAVQDEAARSAEVTKAADDARALAAAELRQPSPAVPPKGPTP